MYIGRVDSVEAVYISLYPTTQSLQGMSKDEETLNSLDDLSPRIREVMQVLDAAVDEHGEAYIDGVGSKETADLSNPRDYTMYVIRKEAL